MLHGKLFTGTAFDAFKIGLVFGVISTHDPVPEIEIQAIIKMRFRVVHVVVGGRVHPPEQPMVGKTSG